MFDPSYPVIDEDKFERRDWSDFYGDIKEEIPDNVPKQLGKELIIRAYVDADCAGDQLS